MYGGGKAVKDEQRGILNMQLETLFFMSDKAKVMKKTR